MMVGLNPFDSNFLCQIHRKYQTPIPSEKKATYGAIPDGPRATQTRRRPSRANMHEVGHRARSGIQRCACSHLCTSCQLWQLVRRASSEHLYECNRSEPTNRGFDCPTTPTRQWSLRSNSCRYNEVQDGGDWRKVDELTQSSSSSYLS